MVEIGKRLKNNQVLEFLAEAEAFRWRNAIVTPILIWQSPKEGTKSDDDESKTPRKIAASRQPGTHLDPSGNCRRLPTGSRRARRP
jgi:hypothetical protein